MSVLSSSAATSDEAEKVVKAAAAVVVVLEDRAVEVRAAPHSASWLGRTSRPLSRTTALRLAMADKAELAALRVLEARLGEAAAARAGQAGAAASCWRLPENWAAVEKAVGALASSTGTQTTVRNLSYLAIPSTLARLAMVGL